MRWTLYPSLCKLLFFERCDGTPDVFSQGNNVMQAWKWNIILRMGHWILVHSNLRCWVYRYRHPPRSYIMWAKAEYIMNYDGSISSNTRKLSEIVLAHSVEIITVGASTPLCGGLCCRNVTVFEALYYRTWCQRSSCCLLPFSPWPSMTIMVRVDLTLSILRTCHVMVSLNLSMVSDLIFNIIS